MAGTALDALIAELLGDVGLLTDEIKALHQTIPAVAEKLNEAAREAARLMADEAATAIKSVKAASEAELARMRVVVAYVAAAALLGGFAGGVLAMYWLGQH